MFAARSVRRLRLIWGIPLLGVFFLISGCVTRSDIREEIALAQAETKRNVEMMVADTVREMEMTVSRMRRHAELVSL